MYAVILCVNMCDVNTYKAGGKYGDSYIGLQHLCIPVLLGGREGGRVGELAVALFMDIYSIIVFDINKII